MMDEDRMNLEHDFLWFGSVLFVSFSALTVLVE